ncbi:MAG: NGG1p interacting factor NIF3 [Gammaproteobacteria bacterium]|nr:NGG1p interacting factor NIF3 [Gammaproteobacteria bacterium]
MHQICFYVPESHLEKVKTALFEEGAGQLGSYDSCCWETEGMGQFRPLKGSMPYIGENNVIEKVREFKVEMMCQDSCLVSVLKKLVEIHPYEVPAYSVYRVNTIKDYLDE